jgi:hypothetical protein
MSRRDDPQALSFLKQFLRVFFLQLAQSTRSRVLTRLSQLVVCLSFQAIG